MYKNNRLCKKIKEECLIFERKRNKIAQITFVKEKKKGIKIQ